MGVNPISGLKSDEFSVRWQGRLKVGKTEDYTFHIEADDGVKLWVDHDLLIDEWKPGVRDLSSKAVRSSIFRGGGAKTFSSANNSTDADPNNNIAVSPTARHRTASHRSVAAIR